MKFNKKFIRILSTSLAALFFIQGAVLCNAAETNFWKDRRKALDSSSSNAVVEDPLKQSNMDSRRSLPAVAGGNDGTLALAQLPATAPGLVMPFSIKALTDIGLNSEATREKRSRAVNALLPDWMQSAIAPYATIHSVNISKNPQAKKVLLIQDAHLQFEAQTNIAGLVNKVSRAMRVASSPHALGGDPFKPIQHGSSIKTFEDDKLIVGLEGADAKEADFSAYNQMPQRKIMHGVAEALLKANILNGVETAAIGYEGDNNKEGAVVLPFTVTGVEDQALFDKNVQALRDAWPNKKKAKEALSDLHRTLQDLKRTAYSKDLSAFDSHLTSYEEGTLALPNYVLYLDSLKSAETPNLKIMIEAALIEGSLNFQKVENQRSRILEKLLGKISEAEMKNLLALSTLFQSGQVTYGAYYDHLKSVCAQKGIKFSDYPELNLYVQYILKTESIDAAAVMTELRSWETEIEGSLAKTLAEKELASLTRDYYLLSKLSDHALTEEEWHRYEPRIPEIRRISDRLTSLEFLPTSYSGEARRGINSSSISAMTPIWPSFENFYRAAVDRNQMMASKFSERLAAQPTKYGVLVAGGFHTQGLLNELIKKDLTVFTLSPKITKIEGGLSSLDVLALNRLPIDRLFAGERLFIPVPSTTMGPKGPQTASMVVGVAGTIAHLIAAGINSSKSFVNGLSFTVERGVPSGIVSLVVIVETESYSVKFSQPLFSRKLFDKAKTFFGLVGERAASLRKSFSNLTSTERIGLLIGGILLVGYLIMSPSTQAVPGVGLAMMLPIFSIKKDPNSETIDLLTRIRSFANDLPVTFRELNIKNGVSLNGRGIDRSFEHSSVIPNTLRGKKNTLDFLVGLLPEGIMKEIRPDIIELGNADRSGVEVAVKQLIEKIDEILGRLKSSPTVNKGAQGFALTKILRFVALTGLAVVSFSATTPNVSLPQSSVAILSATSIFPLFIGVVVISLLVAWYIIWGRIRVITKKETKTVVTGVNLRVPSPETRRPVPSIKSPALPPEGAQISGAGVPNPIPKPPFKPSVPDQKLSASARLPEKAPVQILAPRKTFRINLPNRPPGGPRNKGGFSSVKLLGSVALASLGFISLYLMAAATQSRDYPVFAALSTTNFLPQFGSELYVGVVVIGLYLVTFLMSDQARAQTYRKYIVIAGVVMIFFLMLGSTHAAPAMGMMAGPITLINPSNTRLQIRTPLPAKNQPTTLFPGAGFMNPVVNISDPDNTAGAVAKESILGPRGRILERWLGQLSSRLFNKPKGGPLALTENSETALPPFSEIKTHGLKAFEFSKENLDMLKETVLSKPLSTISLMEDELIRRLEKARLVGFDQSSFQEESATDYKQVIIHSLVSLWLVAGHDAEYGALIRQSFEQDAYKHGMKIYVYPAELLKGAKSAYYPPEMTGGQPALVVSAELLSGAANSKERLAVEHMNGNLQQMGFVDPDVLTTENSINLMDGLVFWFVAEKLWGHELVHHPIDPKDLEKRGIDAVREEEWRVVGSEILGHEAALRVFGLQKDPTKPQESNDKVGTLNFLLYWLKYKIEPEEKARTYDLISAPHRYEAIQNGIDAITEFILKVYQKVHQSGALAMVESGGFNSFRKDRNSGIVVVNTEASRSIPVSHFEAARDISAGLLKFRNRSLNLVRETDSVDLYEKYLERRRASDQISIYTAGKSAAIATVNLLQALKDVENGWLIYSAAENKFFFNPHDSLKAKNVREERQATWRNLLSGMTSSRAYIIIRHPNFMKGSLTATPKEALELLNQGILMTPDVTEAEEKLLEGLAKIPSQLDFLPKEFEFRLVSMSYDEFGRHLAAIKNPTPQQAPAKSTAAIKPQEEPKISIRTADAKNLEYSIKDAVKLVEEGLVSLEVKNGAFQLTTTDKRDDFMLKVRRLWAKTTPLSTWQVYADYYEPTLSRQDVIADLDAGWLVFDASEYTSKRFKLAAGKQAVDYKAHCLLRIELAEQKKKSEEITDLTLPLLGRTYQMTRGQALEDMSAGWLTFIREYKRFKFNSAKNETEYRALLMLRAGLAEQKKLNPSDNINVSVGESVVKMTRRQALLDVDSGWLTFNPEKKSFNLAGSKDAAAYKLILKTRQAVEDLRKAKPEETIEVTLSDGTSVKMTRAQALQDLDAGWLMINPDLKKFILAASKNKEDYRVHAVTRNDIAAQRALLANQAQIQVDVKTDKSTVRVPREEALQDYDAGLLGWDAKDKKFKLLADQTFDTYKIFLDRRLAQKTVEHFDHQDPAARRVFVQPAYGGKGSPYDFPLEEARERIGTGQFDFDASKGKSRVTTTLDSNRYLQHLAKATADNGAKALRPKSSALVGALLAALVIGLGSQLGRAVAAPAAFSATTNAAGTVTTVIYTNGSLIMRGMGHAAATNVQPDFLAGFVQHPFQWVVLGAIALRVVVGLIMGMVRMAQSKPFTRYNTVHSVLNWGIIFSLIGWGAYALGINFLNIGGVFVYVGLLTLVVWLTKRFTGSMPGSERDEEAQKMKDLRRILGSLLVLGAILGFGVFLDHASFQRAMHGLLRPDSPIIPIAKVVYSKAFIILTDPLYGTVGVVIGIVLVLSLIHVVRKLFGLTSLEIKPKRSSGLFSIVLALGLLGSTLGANAGQIILSAGTTPVASQPASSSALITENILAPVGLVILILAVGGAFYRFTSRSEFVRKIAFVLAGSQLPILLRNARETLTSILAFPFGGKTSPTNHPDIFTRLELGLQSTALGLGAVAAIFYPSAWAPILAVTLFVMGAMDFLISSRRVQLAIFGLTIMGATALFFAMTPIIFVIKMVVGALALPLSLVWNSFFGRNPFISGTLNPEAPQIILPKIGTRPALQNPLWVRILRYMGLGILPFGALFLIEFTPFSILFILISVMFANFALGSRLVMRMQAAINRLKNSLMLAPIVILGNQPGLNPFSVGKNFGIGDLGILGAVLFFLPFIIGLAVGNVEYTPGQGLALTGTATLGLLLFIRSFYLALSAARNKSNVNLGQQHLLQLLQELKQLISHPNGRPGFSVSEDLINRWFKQLSPEELRQMIHDFGVVNQPESVATMVLNQSKGTNGDDRLKTMLALTSEGYRGKNLGLFSFQPREAVRREFPSMIYHVLKNQADEAALPSIDSFGSFKPSIRDRGPLQIQPLNAGHDLIRNKSILFDPTAIEPIQPSPDNGRILSSGRDVLGGALRWVTNKLTRGGKLGLFIAVIAIGIGSQLPRAGAATLDQVISVGTEATAETSTSFLQTTFQMISQGYANYQGLIGIILLSMVVVGAGLYYLINYRGDVLKRLPIQLDTLTKRKNVPIKIALVGLGLLLAPSVAKAAQSAYSMFKFKEVSLGFITGGIIGFYIVVFIIAGFMVFRDQKHLRRSAQAIRRADIKAQLLPVQKILPLLFPRQVTINYAGVLPLRVGEEKVGEDAVDAYLALKKKDQQKMDRTLEAFKRAHDDANTYWAAGDEKKPILENKFSNLDRRALPADPKAPTVYILNQFSIGNGLDFREALARVEEIKKTNAKDKIGILMKHSELVALVDQAISDNTLPNALQEAAKEFKKYIVKEEGNIQTLWDHSPVVPRDYNPKKFSRQDTVEDVTTEIDDLLSSMGLLQNPTPLNVVLLSQNQLTAKLALQEAVKLCIIQIFPITRVLEDGRVIEEAIYALKFA